MIASEDFPCERESVPEARHFARRCLDGMPDEFIAIVALLVSELATNAIQHAATPFSMRIDSNAQRVIVEVSDNGDGDAKSRVAEPSDLSGRGLLVVEQLADEWGVRRPSAKWQTTVWFRLELPASVGLPASSVD